MKSVLLLPVLIRYERTSQGTELTNEPRYECSSPPDVFLTPKKSRLPKNHADSDEE
jgi:hypothetical protein